MSLRLPVLPRRIKQCVYLIQNPFLQKSTNIDAIDSFTNELVVRKTLKWELLQQKLANSTKSSIRVSPLTKDETEVQRASSKDESITKQFRNSAKQLLQDISSLGDVELCIEVENLNQYQIDHLLTSSLFEEKNRNFYEIIKQCVQYEKIPSDMVVLDVLRYLSEQGDLNTIINFIDLCSQQNRAMFDEHIEFDHFKAKCLWRLGNSDGALSLLQNLYSNWNSVTRNEDLSYSVRGIFREIVEETVEQKSEAVLITLTKVASHLSKMFAEHQILVYIWQSCFLSSWFSDQQFAIQLFDEYTVIREIIANRTSMLTYTLLKAHNVDAVHRFIELQLKYNMKNECKTCLSFLFDYQYWRRDLRACSEIIRNSLDLDIPLSEPHNQKLLNLLLGGPAMYPNKKAKDVPTKFELKF